MVNLTPTFNQLVVTLTPQPEPRKISLSVAPSTATSEKARQIQRRLGYHFDYNNKGPHTGGDHLPDLPMFEWAAFRAEDDAAAQACEYLQVHFAPEKCTVMQCSAFPGWGRSGIFQMFTCTSEGAKQTTSSSGQGKVGIAGLSLVLDLMSCAHRPWCAGTRLQIHITPNMWAAQLHCH